MLTRVVEVRSVARTRELGKRLGSLLAAGDLVALDGELGAGKTELVRAICEGLGVPSSVVSSPSFAVMSTYAGGRLPVVHADLYRISDEDELYSTGYFDQLGTGAVVLVEWASRVPGALLERRLSVAIDSTGARARQFTISAVGERAEALITQWLGAERPAPPSGTASTRARPRRR